MGKRGLSPLIATVLLIAFAVSIGAVIMTYSASLTECGNIAFTVYEKEGKPDVCYNSKAVSVYAVIENGQKEPLSGFKSAVHGSKNIFNTEVHEILGPAEIKKINFTYDTVQNGGIVKIRFLPLAESKGNDVICPVDKALVVTGIPECPPS